MSWRSQGLSPRIRGNLSEVALKVKVDGSIPAHTGKPSSPSRTALFCRVYPRAYGETSKEIPLTPTAKGLSPRIRGNPPIVTAPAPFTGSIPAHTGKPFAPTYWEEFSRVYPRAYGETQMSLDHRPPPGGLSPRIRGNRQFRTETNARGGSIPAHTGKPGVHGRIRTNGRVYPRAYGETPVTVLSPVEDRGLSPRIRGNQLPPRF